MSGFAKKLNIQNSENPTGNFIRFIRTECLDLWKTESPELRKFNGKFFTLYMYGIFGFAEILNIQNWGNSTGNCVRYMHVMSRFAKKLNVQNCINSKEICVNYIFTECLDLRKN